MQIIKCPKCSKHLQPVEQAPGSYQWIWKCKKCGFSTTGPKPE